MTTPATPWRRALLAGTVTVLVAGAICLGILAALGLIGGGDAAPRPAGTPVVAPPRSEAPTPTPTRAAPSATPTGRPSPSAATPTFTPAPPSTPAPAEGAWRAPTGVDPAARAEQVAGRRGVQVSVAWYHPDRGVQRAGGTAADPAWSTSKVPLALAVIRNGGGASHRGSISAALRQSDNDAADTLWRSLGADDPTRARAVTEVLRRAGDNHTVVPDTRRHPPYSIFGQTGWTCADQVAFLMRLPPLDGSQQVIADMSAVTSGQRWGLGRLPEPVFKGGWGPAVEGGYLVRQFGWYRGADGSRVPVAVSVRAPSFDAGVAAIDEVFTGWG
ncbi:MAG: hypothetical protein GXX86_02970 [Propionibacterium sp.]|nr:hypothetical protein [Propionibacterium sp.]